MRSTCLPMAAFLSLGLPSPVQATGALAIDSSQGSTRYGYSYDYRTQRSAERRALRECGKTCRIVAVFKNSCAAYAADKLPGATIGAAVTGSRSRKEAERVALENCLDIGGIQCHVRVSACD